MAIGMKKTCIDLVAQLYVIWLYFRYDPLGIGVNTVFQGHKIDSLPLYRWHLLPGIRLVSE